MLSVIIPAYNESNVVLQTANRVHEVFAPLVEYELIIVNDGSIDDTEVYANQANARVFSHPTNGGYGHAIKTGVRNAKYDWVAIVDADGTYPIEEFSVLLQDIPAFDMVVGARTGEHYWGSFSKRISRKALIRLMLFVTGENIPDPNSGMRIFRRSIVLEHIDNISSGFSFTVTTTLIMFLNNYFVKYIPIEYHQRVGASKVRIRKDALRVLQILVHAIVRYNPLKIYLLTCIMSGVASIVFALLFLLLGQLGAMLFVLFLGVQFTMVIGAMGLLAESQRANRK